MPVNTRKATDTKGMARVRVHTRKLIGRRGLRPAKEREVLFFPIGIREVARKNEEYQIKARFDSLFVQAENLPDLPLGAVTFNCITEFFG